MIGKRTIFILVMVSAGLLLWSICLAYGLKTGSLAPDFRVSSGEGKALSAKDIQGKAAGIFYETIDTVKQNIQLKAALGKYYDAEPEAVKKVIVRLPVINCAKVFLPLRGIYRSEFRKHSALEGITIYADWTGKMFADYNIQEGASNVFLIDKKGVVRYYSFGKIEPQEVTKVVDLFKKLVEE